MGVVLKRTGGFSRRTDCCLVSGHGCILGLGTYETGIYKDRKNDINMQKIPTVYCFEVEAVVGGGGGLIPSKRSCPLILLISRSKLIWFSWIFCLRRVSVVWLKYLVWSVFCARKYANFDCNFAILSCLSAILYENNMQNSFPAKSEKIKMLKN